MYKFRQHRLPTLRVFAEGLTDRIAAGEYDQHGEALHALCAVIEFLNEVEGVDEAQSAAKGDSEHVREAADRHASQHVTHDPRGRSAAGQNPAVRRAVASEELHA